MVPSNPNDVFCDTAEEGAALGLLGLMTGISEENWCAGWMTGLEFSLWEARAGERCYGMGVISERQSQLLKLLSEECGGWWRWDDERGVTFVRTADWIKMLPTDGAPAAPPKVRTPKENNNDAG